MSIDAGTIYSAVRVKLTDLDRDINGAVNKFNKLSESIDASNKKLEKLEKAGKSMSMKVTAPLVAAGVAAVKFASDFNESVGSVDTVFGEFADKIKSFAKTAAENAGLSMTEVNEAATVLGASLQNANFSMEESANLSLVLTQRAADMAAMFGTSTVQALDAVKAALRGEADPIERFGVGVNEVAIKAKAMELGLKGANGELSQHQKTQARLAVILDQTARAQGRFAEESSGVGGQAKITTAEVKNMAISIGQDLLPIASEILGVMSNVAKNINSIDPATRKTIIAIAGLTATVGPLTLGVTSAIKTVNTLKVALVALSANPIGIAISAVVGLGLALNHLGEKNHQRMLKDVADAFGDIGIEGEKVVKIEEAIARASRGESSTSQWVEMIEQISNDLDVSKDIVFQIALGSKKVTDDSKKQLSYIQQMAKNEKIRLSYIPGTVEWKERELKVLKEIKEIEDASSGEDDQITKRIKAERDYNESLKKTGFLLSNNLITTKEAGNQNIASAREYIDALYDLGYASKSEVGTIGYKALKSLIEIYPDLIKQVDLFSDSQLDSNVQTAEQSGWVDRLSLGFAKYKTAVEEQKDAMVNWRNIGESSVLAMGDAFSVLGKALGEGELGFSTLAKAGLTSLGAIVSSIGDALIAQAAFNIALHGGPLNPLAWAGETWTFAQAGIAKTTGAAITAFAGSFETGGIVPGTSYTGDNMLASVNSGEMILNQQQQARLWNELSGLRNGANGGNITVVSVLDGKKVSRSVTRRQRTNNA